jgi:hypothetical protein
MALGYTERQLDVLDAIEWLRKSAERAMLQGRDKRAEKLDHCADVIAQMGQDLDDATELADIMLDMPTPDQLRMYALQDAQRRLTLALGPPDRINLAEVAYDVIDAMVAAAEIVVEYKGSEGCECGVCLHLATRGPQEADHGPSEGTELPTQPEGRDGPVAAPEEYLADFMMAMQDVVDAYAEHLSSVEIVGAIEMVKDETLEVTRLGNAEAYFS